MRIIPTFATPSLPGRFQKGILSIRRLAFLVVALSAAVPAHAQWSYPPTKTVDASDTYFGTTYKDPYRWLENLKDKEVEGRGSLST